MKKIKLRLAAIFAVAAASFAVCGAFIGFSAKNEKANGEEELFATSSATVAYDSALPDYVKSVRRKGEVAEGKDVKAMLFRSDDEVSKSSVTYNKIINVSKNTADIPLAEFMITPSVASTNWKDYEVRTFRIRLTDVYDSKNYVTISVNYRPDRNISVSCVRAGTADQTERGLLKSGEYSESYGANVNMNFVGDSLKDGMFNVCYFSLDYASKKVYAGDQSRVLVKDLGDPSAILDGELLWNGFTTGECYLSLEFDRYADSSSAKAPKAMIFGINGSSIVGNGVKDETAPSIYLDEDFDENSIPLGEKGKSYPLPKVAALDNYDGAISSEKITAKVYTGYGKENAKEYAVSGDAFLPDAEGDYSIVYYATDKSGNKSEYAITVNVKTALPELSFPNGDIIKRNYISGERLVLPETVITGGSGSYRTTIKLTTFAGKEIEITDGEAELNESGSYTLAYKTTDYIGNTKEFSYVLKVEKRALPMIEERFIPPFTLKDKTLKIPETKAYDFASFDSKTPIDVKVFVSLNGGERKQLDKNLEYVPTETGELKVVYNAKNVMDGEVNEKEYVVKVVSPERVGEYFIDENGKAELRYDKEVGGTFYGFTEDAKLTFINKLPAGQIYLKFSVEGGKNNFKTLSLVLLDSEKYGVSARITLEKASDVTSFISVNGGNKTEFKSSLFTSGESVSLEIKNGFVYYNSAKLVKVYDSPSSDFTGGNAYISLEADEVSAASEILIETLDNQSITNKKKDNIGPYVIWDKETVKYAEAGESVFIPHANVIDVLDPICSVEVYLYSPSGKIVPIKNGKDGQYYTFDECGRWYIMAKAVDSVGNVTETANSIHVSQSEKLPLTIGGVKSEIKRGTKLSFTVKGSEGKTLDIFVTGTDGEFKRIDGTEYTFNEKGEFYLFFYVTDTDTYEYSVKRFKVTVN